MAMLSSTLAEPSCPLVQVICPLTFSPPWSYKAPPFKTNTPSVLIALMLLRVRLFPVIAKVCCPMPPPRLRLPTVGLTSSVTV